MVWHNISDAFHFCVQELSKPIYSDIVYFWFVVVYMQTWMCFSKPTWIMLLPMILVSWLLLMRYDESATTTSLFYFWKCASSSLLVYEWINLNGFLHFFVAGYRCWTSELFVERSHCIGARAPIPCSYHRDRRQQHSKPIHRRWLRWHALPQPDLVGIAHSRYSLHLRAMHPRGWH